MKKLKLALFFFVAANVVIGACIFYKSLDPRIARVENYQVDLQDRHSALIDEFTALKSKVSSTSKSNLKHPALTEWLTLSQNHLFDHETQSDLKRQFQEAETAVAQGKLDSALRRYRELDVALDEVSSGFQAASSLHDVIKERARLKSVFSVLNGKAEGALDEAMRKEYSHFLKSYAKDQSAIAPDLTQAQLSYTYADSMYRRGDLTSALEYYRTGNTYMKRILGEAEQ